MFFELSSNDVKTIENMTWQNVREYGKFMEYNEFNEYIAGVGL
jgi:hypothetical protein